MRAAFFRVPVLRAEDVGIVAANVVAVPALALRVGAAPTAGEPAPLLGLVELLAVLGAIAALATRPPGDRPVERTGLHGWLFAGPLLGAVTLIGADASDHLGVEASGVLGLLTLVTVVAAFVFADRLPVLASHWRRLLVSPFVLVASGWFTALVGDMLDGLDLGELARALFDASAAPDLAPVASLVTFFLLAGSAAFYAMLVVAPRELASPEPHPAVWLVRYVVFAVSAALGAGRIVLL